MGTDYQLLIVLSNIANAYLELGEIDKAFETRQRAYDLALKTKDEFEIHLAEQDLGASYNLLGKSDSALLYLNSAKLYFETNFNPQMLSVVYRDLGVSYYNLDDYDQSKSYYIKSITILKERGYDFPLPGTLSDYGQVLQGTGDFSEGIRVCQEALPLAIAMNYPEVEARVCKCLYLNFKGDSQSDSALFYFERHLILKDSISNIELQKKVLREELEISHSKQKKDIISDANVEIEHAASLRNVWIVGFLVLLLGIIALFFAFWQKRKSSKIIEREKRYLDNLLHNLVHEFRTPLTLIKGPTEELLKKDGENKLLRLVDKNSDQMLRLVNQVLDFAKIKAGRLEVKNEITNLHLFTNDTLALFEPIAHEKNVSLSNQIQAENTTVKIDGDKLFKIVSNLLTNAIKYSKESSKVVLKITVHKGWLNVEVSDTGIGISAADQEKVYNKFYQVDATITRKGEGTGLGLAFVKELVQLMNGEISLISKLGQGTIVRVKLPIEMAEIQKAVNADTRIVEGEEKEISQIEGHESVTNKPKILIIEDNRDLQDFLSQILVEKGYEVHGALNGVLGVEKALEIIPDLVISDVMMPEMDGYQVVQHLKNNFATEHIPVVILSAKASFDSMIEGLGAGADDYLSKPFKSQELILRVANQLKRQEKLQQKYLNQTSSDTPVIKHALIEKIESITTEDLGKQISVEELAEECALSRSQLHRKVKFITGLSTTALLTKIRLDLALIDLQKTDLSVSGIAYKYGYTDPAHFTKLFKKSFSKTPSDIRKQGV